MIRAGTKSVADTWSLAGEVAAFVQPGDLMILSGDLGSGKTAFAQGLARGLGVTEPVTSPAFVLVRGYRGRIPVAHLDVYRLDHLSEIFDIGISEMLDGDGVTIIEWGDVVLPALPSDFLEVRLSAGDVDGPEDDRTIELRPVGPKWPGRMEAMTRALAPWIVPPGPGPC